MSRVWHEPASPVGASENAVAAGHAVPPYSPGLFKNRAAAARGILLSGVVLILWTFPRWWYPQSADERGLFWLSARTEVPGWAFRDEPVNKAAEAALAADRIQNGEFARAESPDSVVRVFFANHYAAGDGELDMFSHTPDRCWTSVGWRLESTEPQFVEVMVNGRKIKFERRIFRIGGNRELVYFGALLGGNPLPYRLDQYRNLALRRAAQEPAGVFGKAFGALDAQLLFWPWKAFAQRRALTGPKQFIRISTPVLFSDVAAADKLLVEFLHQWLVPSNYDEESRSRMVKDSR